jgi:hypothetical protein
MHTRMHHLPYSHRPASPQHISLCYKLRDRLGVVLIAYKNLGNECSNVVYLMKSRLYRMTAASFCPQRHEQRIKLTLIAH